MPTYILNGRTINYLDQGKGPALCLLHGFPFDHRIFAEQVRGLSDRYRLIVPDLPGFGQSRSSAPFTMDSLALDIQHLLQHLHALPCVLGGLSMGGYIALAYEQMCPTDFRGILLMDTKAEADTTEAKANRERMADLARTAGAKAVADQMMPKVLSPWTVRNNPRVVRELRDIMEACPARTIELALHAMRDRPDRTCMLPSVPHPALIVIGQDDVLSPPAVGEAMCRAIPRCRLELIPNAAHLSPMEQPDLVNKVLRDFMDECARYA